jgi:CDP-glucose 4,6-dehydratase
VKQLVARILELMNRTDLEPVILNQATHEIPAQYLDCTRARSLMGWAPRFTLEDGLRETIAWYDAFVARAASADSFAGAAPIEPLRSAS